MTARAAWATPANLARLRAEWDAGTSLAAIGRLLGVSKNTIVGKVHRLGLAARPSPNQFREGKARRASAPPPVPCPAMAPLPSALFARLITEQWPAPRPVIAAPIPIPTLAPMSRPGKECCWPIGTPGTAAFRFCNDETIGRATYCATHDALAHVAVRRREPAGEPAHAAGGDD